LGDDLDDVRQEQIGRTFQLRPYSADAYGDVRELPSDKELVAIEQSFRLRRFREDAYGEAAVTKTVEDWTSIHRTKSEVDNTRIVTWAGITILGLITMMSVLGFLGVALVPAEKLHEDATRVIFLIVGGVIGALYGAKTSKG
jgi:hypothetical protein